jgi:branched-chain amino acid transport system substrate-binding protein
MSKFRKIIIGLLLLSLVLVAFNSVAFAQAPEVKVKIGVMAPITGPAASIGTEQLNWTKLAVEDFNKATGWNVELVQGDTELDPAKAVTVADQLIADADIYGVVGPAGSQEVEATQAKFKEARLVHISGSATRPTLTTTGFDTFFRTVPTDAAQGPTDGNFLAQTLGVSQLFVIDDQSSYSVGLADEASKAFEAAGGKVVARESVTQKDTDFSALVTKIGGSGAEAVFFPGQIASQGALLAKQLAEQGVAVILMGADGFQSDDFVKDTGGTTEGAYVSSFAPDIHNLASSKDMVDRYTKEFGDFATTFGPPSYAAATVVLEAMQRAFEGGKLDRATVRDEVAKTDEKMSVLGGPLSFDENGDVKGASFYIFQIKDSKFQLVPAGATQAGEAAPEATPTASG